ncbi:putative membrane protein [Caldisphaera lagunensis DSM 15908]|uniref:Putative membrane protein n=1 Tax=Caldisphaera lagunensis (strain DSM 15908 / JCM 11604 / ANMR 0165 / IC-154) TaxID=1056495 RepID=L0A9P5_CALLD|nr:vitamin K epoxide reductase family protein [Caldisphaera lagunensis]AFZ70586.1 putative membrane protein [Caldisphaera lagunensis DSM 15908]
MEKNKVFLIFFLISIIGIITSSISFYYVYKANSSPPACYFSGNLSQTSISLDCLKVLKSSYSSLQIKIGNIVIKENLDILAMIYFSIGLIFSLLVLIKYSIIGELIWSIIGFLFVPYLIYLEIYKIRSICIYCTTMHILIISQLILSIYFFIKLSKI